MFLFNFTVPQFSQTWIEANTTTYYYLGNICMNVLEQHYGCAIVTVITRSFRIGIKTAKAKIPWDDDGELKKWKQRGLPRTALTFNVMNSEIKTISWMKDHYLGSWGKLLYLTREWVTDGQTFSVFVKIQESLHQILQASVLWVLASTQTRCMLLPERKTGPVAACKTKDHHITQG